MKDLFESAIVQVALDCIVAMDHEGLITEFNPAAERTFGYTRGYAIGKPLAELLVPPSLRQAHREGLARYLAGGEGPYIGQRIEQTAMRADGSELPVELAIALVPGSQPPAFVGFIRDLTESRRAAEEVSLAQERSRRYEAEAAAAALQWKAEQRFRRLLDAAPDAMIIVERAGKILLVNEQTERLFGHPRSELIGAPVEVLFPARFHATHPLFGSGYFNDPKSHPMGSGLELYGARADGSEFPLEISLAPMETEEGPIVIAAIRDVSERRRAEARTRDAEVIRDRLIAMLEATPDFVGFANARTAQVVYVNRAGRRMCGVPDDADVTKMRISDFHPDWANRKLVEEYLPAAAERGVYSGEISFIDREGHEIPTLMMLMAHRSADGQLETFSTISRDISDRKRAEEIEHRLLVEESARQAAEEAVRIRDDFVAVAGHELKTPLSALLLQIQVAMHALHTGAATHLQDRLERALHSGDRLEKLISQLLDVSRITAGRLRMEPERFDLVELAREVAGRFVEASQRSGSALTVRADGPIEGWWDRFRIDQVFTNLLSNALKYGQGQPVDIELRSGDDHAIIRVTDRGIGIDMEHQQKLFQRFERAVTSREFGGLGLGLWISRQIVETSGGRIDVTSSPGRGSTFTVRLPIEAAIHAPL
jgi:protein-histidine pros-kinase